MLSLAKRVYLVHLVCVCYSQKKEDAEAEILRYEFENDGSGPYYFLFSTSNGIEREEKVEYTNANGRGDHYQLTGMFSYKGSDGVDYIVKYTADKDGFHPEGDHFTVPPYTPWNVEYDESGKEIHAPVSPSREASYRQPKTLRNEETPSNLYLPSKGEEIFGAELPPKIVPGTPRGFQNVQEKPGRLYLPVSGEETYASATYQSEASGKRKGNGEVPRNTYLPAASTLNVQRVSSEKLKRKERRRRRRHPKQVGYKHSEHLD